MGDQATPSTRSTFHMLFLRALRHLRARWSQALPRIDNVVGHELVRPNGTVMSVTSKGESGDDLCFGLRVSRQVRYKLASLTVSNYREVSIVLYAISLQPWPISWLDDF
jgi:hypothetical protein